MDTVTISKKDLQDMQRSASSHRSKISYLEQSLELRTIALEASEAERNVLRVNVAELGEALRIARRGVRADRVEPSMADIMALKERIDRLEAADPLAADYGRLSGRERIEALEAAVGKLIADREGR